MRHRFFCVAGIAMSAQDSLQLKVDVQQTALDVYVDDASGKPVTNLSLKTLRFWKTASREKSKVSSLPKLPTTSCC